MSNPPAAPVDARERALFEAHWRATRGSKRARRELVPCTTQPQVYVSDSANRHFVTWQARAALSAPVVAPAERPGDVMAAILALSHRLDDAAQGITERQAYDLASELRVLLGIDGATAQAEAIAAPPVAVPAWMPIETAPKDGRTLLLGYPNSHGKWRTLRGQWFSQDSIDETWEEPDQAGAGWYETPVEIDDTPNVFWTEPTHWMPLPAPPAAAQGGEHG